MKDVAARKRDAAGADLGQLRVRGFEAFHVMGRIAGPALAADVLVEPAVAVGDDIETRDLLLAQINGERVDVLFPEAAGDHRIEKRLDAEVFGVPTRDEAENR